MPPSSPMDSMLESASEEQRRKGVLPTVRDNAEFLKGVMETFDNKPKATVKPDAQPKGTAEDQMRREYEKRTKGRKGFDILGDFRMTRRSETPIALGGSVVELKRDTPRTALLRKRIRLLASKPDWHARMKRINPYALQGKAGKTREERDYNRKQAKAEWDRILDDSDKVFGDWDRAIKERRLYSYAGQAKR